MFLPQCAETDILNATGQQEDDINSVVEYIDQVILGHHDDTPEDEDDDSGQNFHLVKYVDYVFQPFFVASEHRLPETQNSKRYPVLESYKILSVYFDILSPPPEYC